MGKAPSFQFYIKDWLSDPALQAASSSTRGIWINALCFMWEAPQRGELVATPKSMARLLGATAEEFDLFVSEAIDLKFGDVTFCNSKVTLRNRRMYREQQEREKTRERVAKYRAKQASNAGGNKKVTPPSSSSSSSSGTKVPEEKKEEPLTPAGQVCVYCGIRQEDAPWGFDLDHFVPRSAGGSDDPDNLVTACHVCNQIKQKRKFSSVEEARNHIHWTLWESGRKRYEEARRLCFGGEPPKGSRPATVRVGSGPLQQSRFQEFWQAYPRKVGKGAARRAWAKIKPSQELLAEMLQALAWQTKSEQWTRDGGQFIPNPATWLNQERWNDEPPATARASPFANLSPKGQRTAENLQRVLARMEAGGK